MELEELRSTVRGLVADPSLTYRQRVHTSDRSRVDTGVRHASTVLGAGSVRDVRLDDRRVQREEARA